MYSEFSFPVLSKKFRNILVADDYKKHPSCVFLTRIINNNASATSGCIYITTIGYTRSVLSTVIDTFLRERGITSYTVHCRVDLYKTYFKATDTMLREQLVFDKTLRQEHPIAHKKRFFTLTYINIQASSLMRISIIADSITSARKLSKEYLSTLGINVTLKELSESCKIQNCRSFNSTYVGVKSHLADEVQAKRHGVAHKYLVCCEPQVWCI